MQFLTQKELDRGFKGAVHVEGWNKAARFFYVETQGEFHIIKTGRKPIRFYKTKNRLYHTQRNSK